MSNFHTKKRDPNHRCDPPDFDFIRHDYAREEDVYKSRYCNFEIRIDACREQNSGNKTATGKEGK